MAALRFELELEDRERKIHVLELRLADAERRLEAAGVDLPPGGQGGAVKLLVLVALRERSARARRFHAWRAALRDHKHRAVRREEVTLRSDALQFAEQCLAKCVAAPPSRPGPVMSHFQEMGHDKPT